MTKAAFDKIAEGLREAIAVAGGAIVQGGRAHIVDPETGITVSEPTIEEAQREIERRKAVRRTAA